MILIIDFNPSSIFIGFSIMYGVRTTSKVSNCKIL
ncbi:hypothetical protein RDI58_012705 [Solanum bulbocastanum]|uniref:Uncharacterized protein n=1 Tax=Solanum bulbocastanum TaxID=147425 RepID=A0AAN8YEL1_SOLBU